MIPSSQSASAKILFVTGTDTGVGKTLLTSLLLCFLRQRGVHALAIKPFCSGDRADAKVIARLQPSELSMAQINPHFFPEPVAPWVAAGKGREAIRLSKVIRHIKGIARKCDYLIVEGCGGLKVTVGQWIFSGRFDRQSGLCRGGGSTESTRHHQSLFVNS